MLYIDQADMAMGYKLYADTGSGFVAVDGLRTATLGGAAGSLNRLLGTDESTDLLNFTLTDGSVNSNLTALSFDLSSLGAF